MKFTRSLGASAVVALVVSLLAGCTSTTPAENVADACASLATLDDVIASAPLDLQTATTVGDVREVYDAVAAAYDDAESTLDPVASDKQSELSSAWDAFTEEASHISNDTPVAEAQASLADDATQLSDAYLAFSETRDCP